jgi:hypothetical protein
MPFLPGVVGGERNLPDGRLRHCGNPFTCRREQSPLGAIIRGTSVHVNNCPSLRSCASIESARERRISENIPDQLFIDVKRHFPYTSFRGKQILLSQYRLDRSAKVIESSTKGISNAKPKPAPSHRIARGVLCVNSCQAICRLDVDCRSGRMSSSPRCSKVTRPPRTSLRFEGVCGTLFPKVIQGRNCHPGKEGGR